jgi:large subunit ribosomal protein L10
MQKSEKERVVAELAERLRQAESLIVADYRGLTHAEIDDLRGQLLQHGARFSVVKNTLTRRAAEAAGAEALLALLEGPTAIAFIEAGRDPVAVAKAIADTARTTRVLAIRGGLLEGREVSAGQVEELAKLPPFDVLRGQVLGAVSAPLTAIVGLFTAPLQNLAGLIDARIRQLEEQDQTAEPAAEEPQGAAEEVTAEAVTTEQEPAEEAAPEETEQEPAEEAATEEAEEAATEEKEES